MSTTDEWDEKLRCPKCSKTGVASLSQDDNADTPTVQLVPNGFKVLQTEFGPDFYCETCDIAVEA
jgi:hypothetical protein